MVSLLEAPSNAFSSLAFTLRPQLPCRRSLAIVVSCWVKIILVQRTGNGKKRTEPQIRESGEYTVLSTGVTGATLQLLAFAKMGSPNVCGFFFKNFGFFFKMDQNSSGIHSKKNRRVFLIQIFLRIS